MDATDMTGTVTGIGTRRLARRSSKIVGHPGARGTAFSNIESLMQTFDIEEVRINSKRPETRERLAGEIRARLSLNAGACDSAEDTVRDADIVIEVTRPEKHEVLSDDAWLKPDCLLVTYGWVMAVDPATVRRASKVVVDDWEQCRKGGQLYPLIESGELTRAAVHGEIGEIAAGAVSGRENGDGIIVYWHRGFAISDLMLGSRALRESEDRGVGAVMTLFDREDE